MLLHKTTLLVVVRRLVQHKSQEDSACQEVTAILVMYVKNHH